MTQSVHAKLATFTEGKGQTVVLLHGQISTHHYMSLVAAMVSKRRQVTSFDLLGFGDSPRPKDSAYSPDDHVAAIIASWPTKARPAIVVGHSMGALIAVRLAKTHPELVKAIILSALPVLPKHRKYAVLAKEFPGTRLILRGPQAKLMHRWQEKHEDKAMQLAVRLSKKNYSHLLEQARADTVRHSWEAYHRSMKHFVMKYDVFQDLAKLKIPIIILYGENDYISKDVARLADSFNTNILLQVVPGAKHNLPLEHPEVLAEAILSV